MPRPNDQAKSRDDKGRGDPQNRCSMTRPAGRLWRKGQGCKKQHCDTDKVAQGVRYHHGQTAVDVDTEPVTQQKSDNDVSRPHGREGIDRHAKHHGRPDLDISSALSLTQRMQQELEPQGPQEERRHPDARHHSEVDR